MKLPAFRDVHLIALLALIKLILHLVSNTNYGFHRDEFLYLAEARHLAWGFMEVPPFTPFVGSLAQLLGGSLFVARLFPTLAGTATIILIGLLVKELGGKKWAILLACLAFLVSPGFLRSNTLFQPVTFNQFFWFLSAFWLVRLIRLQDPKYWYFLGITIGIGFLNKYSIVFYELALAGGMLLTYHRKWFATRHPWVALAIALLIASPNIFWQFNHNLPVIGHMQSLRQYQFVHVSTAYFFSFQFLMPFAASVIWLGGLIYLFRSKQGRPYRIFAWAYLLVILILLFFSGKPYYALGAYPILFVFGGLAFEQWLRSSWKKGIVALLIAVLNLGIIPYSLTILPIEQMEQYCAYMSEQIGLEGPLYWEDGVVRSIPQDYADMFGWEEIAQRVSHFYHNLPEEERRHCMIQGGNYGHAGAINHFRGKYNLPEAYSFNSSFIMWLPDSLDFKSQILVDDVRHSQSPYFNQVVLVDSIRHPYARENGYIYYRTEPKVEVAATWKALVQEEKKRFGWTVDD